MLVNGLAFSFLLFDPFYLVFGLCVLFLPSILQSLIIVKLSVYLCVRKVESDFAKLSYLFFQSLSSVKDEADILGLFLSPLACSWKKIYNTALGTASCLITRI